MAYETIVVSKEDGVAVIELHRPEALNALNQMLIGEIVTALEECETDQSVLCTVITGSAKAFAAGADIREMADAGAIEMLYREKFVRLDRIRHMKKPVIAAVAGFALGGGCELAMMCDIIIAADTARFAQPEVSLGIIPGWGGTQRLARTVGKYKAMEMILTGDMMSAEEALRCGLVAKVVPADTLVAEAKALAKKIAAKAPLAVRLAKESVLQALDATMPAGLEVERRNFFMLFASEDQKEGMKAFLEKRKPVWKGK